MSDPQPPLAAGLGREVVGLRVEVSQFLVGFKHGFCDGRTVLVSPAMWDLMRHAEGDELERLLKAIPLKPMPKGFFDPPDLGKLWEMSW